MRIFADLFVETERLLEGSYGINKHFGPFQRNQKFLFLEKKIILGPYYFFQYGYSTPSQNGLNFGRPVMLPMDKKSTFKIFLSHFKTYPFR